MTDPIVIPGRIWQANSYIFDDIIIDAGITEDRITPYKDQIKKIVVTHGHFDHIAHIDKISELCDAEIYIGEHEYEFLFNNNLSLSELFGAEQPKISTATKLHDGDSIDDFTVYHTPGHTQGGICLFHAIDGVLVSGDTIFPGGDYGRCDLPTGRMADMKRSITRLAELPVESIWCGHGTPAPHSGREQILLSQKNVMLEP